MKTIGGSLVRPSRAAGTRVRRLRRLHANGGKVAGRTPVFGDTIGARRLLPSGWLRRLADRVPLDKGEHWVLLLAADRLDVWEHRLRPLVLAAAAFGGAAFVTGLLRPSPRMQ